MADRYDFYYRQKVTEAELDASNAALEQADRDQFVDTGFAGITNGLTVSETTPTPNFTVDVAAGIAYTDSGERIKIPSLQNADVSLDYLSASTAVVSPGNSKIVSLLLEFQRSLSDPRIDGNSLTVYFQRDESYAFKVRQSAEAPSPTAPSVPAGEVLLADITRTYGDTSIIDAVIDHSRASVMFPMTGTPFASAEKTIGSALQAIADRLNALLTGANSWSGTNSFDNTDADVARLTTAESDNMVLIWESQIEATPARYLRIYHREVTSAGLYPGLVVTTNAKYRNATSDWAGDSTATEATMLAIGRDGLLTFATIPATLAASWADSVWATGHNTKLTGVGALSMVRRSVAAFAEIAALTDATDLNDAAFSAHHVLLLELCDDSNATAPIPVRVYASRAGESGSRKQLAIVTGPVYWDTGTSMWVRTGAASDGVQRLLLSSNGMRWEVLPSGASSAETAWVADLVYAATASGNDQNGLTLADGVVGFPIGSEASMSNILNIMRGCPLHGTSGTFDPEWRNSAFKWTSTVNSAIIWFPIFMPTLDTTHTLLNVSVDVLLKPGAARATSTNRMRVLITHVEPNFSTPAVPSEVDETTADTRDDGTANTQVVTASAGTVSNIRPGKQLFVKIIAGNDAGTNLDAIYGIRVNYDTPVLASPHFSG